MEQSDHERTIKRVRMACLNCRRKKIRCSGTQPVCQFCARLNQQCEWDEIPSALRQGQDESQVTLLAARIEVLESRLSLMNAQLWDDGGSIPTIDGDDALPLDMPDPTIVQAVVDVYFQKCWNQPYCYFEEAAVRQKLAAGDLPSYLLLAILATAARFCDSSLFEHRPLEAADRFARLAWDQINEQTFSDEHKVSIHMVQAASMLGVIDFIRGRVKVAWVKIGLSIRFAQGLGLGNEADSGLPYIDQEERRRTFWSVYLLDRIVSCGQDRPPALLDDYCSIALPRSQRKLESRADVNMPTLSDICDLPEVVPLERDDFFAATVFMASILGGIVRYHFLQNAKPKYPLWDSRSEFCRLHAALLSFETFSDATDADIFARALTFDFCDATGENIDRHACHFVFAHFLYHLNYCLLHHPILMQRKLQHYKGRIPLNFYREAVQRSSQHATSLSAMLGCLLGKQCSSYPSFYGYGATIAGGLHKLRMMDPQSSGPTSAKAHLNNCLQYLKNVPGQWEHHSTMLQILEAFAPSPALSAILFFPGDVSLISDPGYSQMWKLVDYGWLSAAGADRCNGTPETSTRAVFTADSALSVMDPPSAMHSAPPSAVDSFTYAVDLAASGIDTPQAAETNYWSALLTGGLALDDWNDFGPRIGRH